MENISENITYREATHSTTAIANGIKNEPDKLQLLNMKLLAGKVFEPMRKRLGSRPIHFASFFRCVMLNQLVGGAHNSDHMAERGAAADIDNDNIANAPTNREIFYDLLNNAEFDQLIWEYGDDNSPDWVHVSYRENGNLHQVLRCRKGKYYPFV